MCRMKPASSPADRRRAGALVMIAALAAFTAGCNGKGLVETNTGGNFRQINLDSGLITWPFRYYDPSTAPGTSMVFREIPSEEGASNAFFMSVYEVTQSQWMELVGGSGPWPWQEVEPEEAVGGTDTAGSKPMYGETLDHIRSELSIYNSGKKFTLRLPTRSEWERACAGGSTGSFSWGGNRSLERANRYAVVRETRTTLGPMAVGSKLPNEFGMYDMHGNVWEWSRESNGTTIGIHGGSWKDNLYSARTLGRQPMHDEIPHGLIGLRLVLVLK
jgi:formylglycine-generating enzyme required for sulfatase activity